MCIGGPQNESTRAATLGLNISWLGVAGSLFLPAIVARSLQPDDVDLVNTLEEQDSRNRPRLLPLPSFLRCYLAGAKMRAVQRPVRANALVD
jgi:hypothetical protein